MDWASGANQDIGWLNPKINLCLHRTSAPAPSAVSTSMCADMLAQDPVLVLAKESKFVPGDTGVRKGGKRAFWGQRGISGWGDQAQEGVGSMVAAHAIS